MLISGFIKTIMPSSVILKEEIKEFVHQINGMAVSSLVELYVDKENDLFFEVNIRIKKGFYSKKTEECQNLFYIEDSPYYSSNRKINIFWLKFLKIRKKTKKLMKDHRHRYFCAIIIGIF